MAGPRRGAQSSDARDFVTTLCDPPLAHESKWRLNSPLPDYYGASSLQSGSTRSEPICSSLWWNSISKMPVMVAGNETLIVSPAGTSSSMS